MVTPALGRGRVGRPVGALVCRTLYAPCLRSLKPKANPRLSNPPSLARFSGYLDNMFRINLSNFSLELLLTGERRSGILDA